MRASYPSILVFSWVSSIIHVGWKKPLTKDDLYDLDPDNTCNVVNLKVLRSYTGKINTITSLIHVLKPFMNGQDHSLISISFETTKRIPQKRV